MSSLNDDYDIDDYDEDEDESNGKYLKRHKQIDVKRFGFKADPNSFSLPSVFDNVRKAIK